jgi:hypothetical protein
MKIAMPEHQESRSLQKYKWNYNWVRQKILLLILS